MIESYRTEHTFAKILSVTCDNASPNDTMIDKLKEVLKDFQGKRGQVQCFMHVINLIAKSIIKQFDVPKCANCNDTDKLDDVDELLQELAALVADIDLKDKATQQGQGTADNDNEEEDNNEDGFIDKQDEMSPVEWKELERDTWPVCLMLIKVCDNFC